jgi:hypothetical protein
MSFEEALTKIKQLERVARKGWNGKGMFVVFRHATSDCNQHLVIRNVKGTYDTWVPSVSDLFAEDWEVIK